MKMSYIVERNRKLEAEWKAFNERIKEAQSNNVEKKGIDLDSNIKPEMSKSNETATTSKARATETSKSSSQNKRGSQHNDEKHQASKRKEKYEDNFSSDKKIKRRNRSPSKEHTFHHNSDKKERRYRSRSTSHSKSPKSSHKQKSTYSSKHRHSSNKQYHYRRSRSTEKHLYKYKNDPSREKFRLSKSDKDASKHAECDSKSDTTQFVKLQVDDIIKKDEEITDIKIPSFYSSKAINPLIYAEQEKKRKLLWSKTKDNDNTSTKIVGQAFLDSSDEKTAEKFRKLMGLKPEKTHDFQGDIKTEEINKMQKKTLEALDKEYEYARFTTHMNRGKGLGFSTHTVNVLMNQRNLPK